MNKRIKITTIVLSTLSILFFVFSVLLMIDCYTAKIANNLSGLAIIVLLPLFFISTVAILVFAIILLCLLKKAKKMAVQNETKVKWYELLLAIIPIIFVFINAIMFLMLYLI